MDKELRIKIKIDSETAKLETLNSKINDTSKGFNKADSMVSAFTNRILMLGGAYLSLNTVINGGKNFIHQADAMHLLDSRLKLATTSTVEYESQQKKLLKVSLDSYTPLSDTINLFTKLNPSLQKVGASTNQVNTMVGTFTKGLQLGGASAQDTSSAILQFSQAMGSGVLRGEEFNAMADASPKLMEYLAKGLGVPQTALRKMAEEGELASVRVTNALLAVKTDIERGFLTMPVTFRKAMTNMSTNMSLAIKEIDEATGASTLLSSTIIDFTRNISDGSESIISFYEGATNFIKEHNDALDTTGTILKTVTAGYIGFAVTSGVATGIGAITTSVYALRTSILVLQTSIPIIGWVAAAVGTAAGAYVLANDMINESNNQAEISTDRLKEKIKELEDRKASLAQNRFKDSNEKTINLEIEALQSKLKLQEQFTKKQIQSSTSIIPLSEKTAVAELIGEFDGYAKTIDKITEKKKTFSELTQEIQKQIDPVRAIHEEYNKLRKDIKGSEADTPEYNKNLNKKELDDIAKLDKEKISKAKELATEQKRIAKEKAEVEAEFSLVGLTTWDSKFKELDNKYNADLSKYQDVIGAKEKIDAIYANNVKEISNQKNNEVQIEDLSYYERRIQLQTESYEKELELQGIGYGQKVLDIDNSNKPIEEKEKLIGLESELFDLTLSRLELERNTEFQETISGFYDDMLESQISLNSALYDFGDGFGEVGNKIASVSKSLATMTNADLKSKKELAKLNDKYAKEFKRYAKDETKTKKLLIAYEEEEQQLKQQTLMNQIGGLSEFAGQSKQFFGEQTGAYKVLNALEAVGHAARMTAMAAELPGQITSLGVNIANALAGQGSIPIVGFALVAGMAALLAGLGVMSAGGGGGGSASSGGGSSKPSEFDIKEQELEDLYTPMTDRLDRQIELLESIDKQGSASALSLTAAKISFERDYQLAVNEINKSLPTDVRGYGLDFNNSLAYSESKLGFNVADVVKIMKSGWDKSEKRIYTDFSSLSSGFNMLKLISHYFETGDGAIAALFGGSNKLNLAANEIQKVIGDFTSGIVDSLDDMKSASSEFKDIYDSMTGTMYYENKRLVQAFNEVEILTKNGDLATYLKNNIDEIDNLQEIFTNSVMSTLLSQDPKDMAKQIVVLEQLQTKTGLVFENGARDALDFMESITLVSEAMVGSRENISTFINDFKSEDLIALDLSNKLGTNLALNYDDLALKFEDMANDIYGLTDSELEFLEANKSYLERIQDAKKQALEDELELTKSSVSTIQSMSNSLDSVITKLRGNLSTTAATSIAKFNESMSSTLLLSNGNDYKALEDSLKNTISYSDALNNADYFSSSRDMQFAQAIAANQFESMDVKLEDELSVLQQISANTSAMIEALENSASFDIYAQNLETSVKIKAFANGGIVTGPTFGLIGEAGYSEAVIPLKNPNDPLGQKELIAEIRALRKEVADLNNSSSKTAENTTPSRYVS